MIFRRKQDKPVSPDSTSADTESTDSESSAETTGTANPRESGPFDSGEVAYVPGEDERADLGSILIGMSPQLQLHLQVDESQQEVVAALVVADDSAIELRAFAAPKKSGIWDEVREEMVSEAERMGGRASRQDGPFGPELLADLPATDPEGQPFVQRARMIGVDGPRWFLRGTILGRAAEDAEAAVAMENIFRDVIVVRGDEPMAPREPLPLTLPPDLEAAEQE